MGSPPTGILRPPRLTMTRRKPLQPKNPPSVPAPLGSDPAKPEKRQKLPAKSPIEASAVGKENCAFPDVAAEGAGVGAVAVGREVEVGVEVEVGSPMDMSLAEELGAARRRVERLRSERERTERVLNEIGLAIEKGVRNGERRWREQRIVEAEIGKLLRGEHVGQGQSKSAKSLREKEQERRNIESQAQEIKNEKVDIIGVEQNSEPKISKEVEDDIDKMKDGSESQEKHKDNKDTIDVEPSAMKERLDG